MNNQDTYWTIFEESLAQFMRSVNEKRERVLEEVAEAGIDPRLVRFEIDYHTEDKDGSYFLTAVICPRFIDASGLET